MKKKDIEAMEKELIEKVLKGIENEVKANHCYKQALAAARKKDAETCKRLCKQAISYTREDHLKRAATGLYNVASDPVKLDSMIAFISRDDLGND